MAKNDREKRWKRAKAKKEGIACTRVGGERVERNLFDREAV